MKRLSLTLAALGMSVGAFASLPAGATSTGVTVPQLPGGFVIGGSGFYLQPSHTDADLAYASTAIRNTAGTVTASNSTISAIKPGFAFGWGAHVGYVFPNTGNDINVSYFHFDKNNSASTSVAGFNNALGQQRNGNFILPINLTVSNGDAYQNASATAKYNLDQVDLTAGQYINIGSRLSVHPIAGVRWAQLDRKLNENYFALGTSGFNVSNNPTSNLGNGTLVLNEKSDFNGIGPMIGSDVSYYIGGGVGVVGHADTALLFGNINANTTEAMTRLNNLFFPVSQPATFNGTYATNSTRRVVPVVDGKLGLDYTYLFNNASNSDLTLEAGWQGSKYFNAVDRLVAVDGTAGGVIRSVTSNLSFAGPYVDLTFHA